MNKFGSTPKATWQYAIDTLKGMIGKKADRTEIPVVPDALKNPHPVTFSGIMPQVSYDGSSAVTVNLPNVEMMNESAGTPVGEIISYMGNAAPVNYLACDGTVYNIADYPELSQHFADEFGVANHFGGDGITTFAVPDLRGEFLRGTGENSHSYTFQNGTVVFEGSGGSVGEHKSSTLFPNVQVYSGANNQVSAVSETYSTVQNITVSSQNADSVVEGTTKIWTVQLLNPNKKENTKTFYSYSSRPTSTSVLYCIKYRSTHNLITQSHVYSLEERRVGYWIDNKPLYEKTVDCGAFGSSIKVVPHNIENVETIFISAGYVYALKSTQKLSLAYPAQDPNGSWDCSVDAINVQLRCYRDRSAYHVLTVLRYTKTTD